MAGETKKRIIETALALFSQSGYLATSMNDIAQQVGLTKAALYKHFSGKQEILDCIIASTASGKSVMMSNRIALHPLQQPHADEALVDIPLQHKFRPIDGMPMPDAMTEIFVPP